MYSPSPIVIVHRETRLEGVLRRWGTRGQAKFVIRQAAARERARQAERTEAPARSRRTTLKAPVEDDAYTELEDEDQVYRGAVAAVQRELNLEERVQLVHRDYVPTFDFGSSQVVVVLGQDGMVANVAKYVQDVPIVGVNPDPARFDGVLLPFQVSQARAAVHRVLKQTHKTRRVTLAEALLNDGQRLVAFNDLFIGNASHVSARYAITHQGRSEQQSSSGIIVSTGAGSTGWLSSVFNMASGVAGFLGSRTPPGVTMSWEERKLVWVVREPFKSRHSQTTLVAGALEPRQELVVQSAMPEGGVIFSDGIERDFLAFNSGAIARFQIAQQTANLVVA
jgi:NAD kinase